ncbi:MAG TPA: EF-hand domain-containing protein [Planctomycetaceae bacterium]|nr:EF-hand domain-containing protein [Planctomycetaceae bacterium]
MPSSFRSSLEKSGVNLDRGVSREVFIREIPKAFEQMREERERDEERRRDDSRRGEEDSRRSDDRSRREPTPDRTPAPKAVSVYTPRKKVEITVDLPRRFEDGDTDGDGQIGLYEWRKWRPEERAHFKVYDKNGDGFLTPRELLKPPTSAELIAAASGTTASVATGTSPAPAAAPSAPSERGDRSFSRGGDRNRRGPTSRRDESSREERVVPTSTTATGSPGSPAAVAVTPVEDPTTRTAKLFFARMDADNNKQITSEEWARSRTVKPKFEEAGIDVSNALSEQQFIEAYKKAYGK